MYRKTISVGALALALVGCGGEAEETPDVIEAPEIEEPGPAAAGVGQEAEARLINEQGTEIGTARLTQQPNGVEIVVDLAFLQAGERGFHIHETGTCEAPSFESAGGHFNPTNASHGFEHPQGPHAGDMRNLEVETDDGTARATILNERVTLVSGQPNSLLDGDGTAFVVHSGADDYQTQPSGDAGSRIACGVIEPA